MSAARQAAGRRRRSPARPGAATSRPGRDVAVVGSSAWALTLADQLGRAGSRVRMWDPDEAVREELATTRTIEAALPRHRLPRSVGVARSAAEVAGFSHLVFVVVPSERLRALLARHLAEHLDAEHLLVHSTKGLERDSGRRMSEVIREETCVRRIGVLSGPNRPRQVLEREPSASVVASRYPEVVKAVQEVLDVPHVRLYGSDDLIGVELGGAIKNVLAIALGVAQGLGLGENTCSLVAARGLREMIRVGSAAGADWETFTGLSGIGDLIGAALSADSVHRRLGERIARGEPVARILGELDPPPEGVPTAHGLERLIERLGVDAPISQGIHRVLYRRLSVKKLMHELMARPTAMELAGRRGARGGG